MTNSDKQTLLELRAGNWCAPLKAARTRNVNNVADDLPEGTSSGAADAHGKRARS